jgi:hypothetical protein
MPEAVGRTVSAQLMDHVSRCEFQRCVARYDGEYKTSRFSCCDQFLRMAFAQLTYRELARYRGVSPRVAAEAGSRRHSRPDCPIHPRRCQRIARRAHLLRLCPGASLGRRAPSMSMTRSRSI